MSAPTKSQGIGQVKHTKPLTLKNYLGYGAGDMANNLGFSLVISFLMLYYTDVALISPATVGFIFLIMRIVDAFTDLLVGSVVDRTSTRWGKFRPYILFFSAPLALMAVLVFSMPASLHGTPWAVVFAAVTYFLLGSVFFTLVNVPYGSLAAAMTQNSDERAKLATFRSVGAGAMQLITALAIAPSIRANSGDPAALQSSLTQTIIILAVVSVALHLFLFASSREQVARTTSKVSMKGALRTLSKNSALFQLSASALLYVTALFTLTGLTVYYARDVLGDAGFIPVALALCFGPVLILGWFVPPLVKTIGKRRLYIIGALLGTAGCLTLAAAPAGSYLFAVLGFLLIGCSSGFCNLLMWNLEADTIDFGEWKTGERTEGTTYAVFSFTRKLGQSFGGALGAWIIGWFGYNGAQAVQDATSILGIRIAIGVAPAIIFFLSAVVMLRYRLTESTHREIVGTLQERHALARSATDESE